MFSYRICKYNPQYREKDGTYTIDEWTEFSDIGKIFCGKMLTDAEYFQIENNYISCIISILKKNNLLALRIDNLENYRNVAWENEESVPINMLSHLLRDCLINNCWCKLSGADFYVHFGYDFYIYIGCLLPPSEVTLICFDNNLFCEQIDSPYN